VRVNGRLERKGALVSADDEIEVVASPAKKSGPTSNVILEILYEDAGLLIVNKPPLLPCHPLHANNEASVITLLADDYPEVYSSIFAEDGALGVRPLEGGLIHRLDNGTSGALMIARAPDALRLMREALRAGRVYRRYEALIAGSLDRPVELTWPIAHHRKNPARMVIVDESPLTAVATRAEKIVRAPYRGTPRDAFGYVEPVAHLGNLTLVNVTPRTGRRHQIRIHLAGIGRPIVGDELYGGPPMPPLAEGRFWLHLTEVRFDAPSGHEVRVTAPRPNDLTDGLAHTEITQDAVTPETRIHVPPGQRLPQRSRIATSASGLRRTPPNLSRG
jgi:23S rRNA pseudouridine1911/1915/1917 synthase